MAVRTLCAAGSRRATSPGRRPSCPTPAATPGAPPAAAATAAEAAPAPAPDAPAPGDAAVIAELREVSGPAGVRTPDLPEGAFLGKGAKLRAGQRVIVPRGTLAEIVLDDGGTLRINEESALVLPAGKRSITLEGGELVALITSGQAPLDITAAGDTFTVKAGEARVLSQGGAQRYAVVYGAATVQSGGKSVDLGPGATLDTPIVESRPVEPVISLRPLEETAWARAFDVAAQMADAVPMGVGSLTARRAGESAERYSLRLVDHKVNVTISGRIARTEIEQTFYNEAPLVLEGTYRFPLPADASISGLSLLVGNQWMEAAMLEKERARQIFKEIVDATVPRDPALLEWEHGNIFKLKIFPIPGRGERKIRLSYTQVLPVVGDTLRYRYPMSGASTGATGTEIENFEFTIAVDKAELPATGTLATPMAELSRRELADRVELGTRAQRFRPVHDLGVDIPIPPDDQRIHTETHLDRDGQAYFMLAFRPDLQLPAVDRPRHYAFVLDRSHSVTPELWTVARSLVQSTAATLQADDRITVLACDAACDTAPGGLAPPSETHLAGVERFLDGQLLAGASDVGGMMRSAAEALGGADSVDPRTGAERVIVYLGDGSPSAGALAPDELLRELERPLAGTRVQAIALGARSDLLVLSALTKKTGGDLLRADAKDDLRGLVRELRLRAALPVAREVSLTLPDGMVYTHPDAISAVRPGETITLVGKLSKPVHGPLTLRATAPDGRPVQDTIQVDLEAVPGPQASRRAHLPRTWAREEIEALTASRGHSARGEIIDLSRQYTVLSRYTALLVLENDAMYREFNVVRQAGRTTGWTGKVGEAAPVTAGSAAASTPVATPKPTAPPAELPDPAAAEPTTRADAKDVGGSREQQERAKGKADSPDNFEGEAEKNLEDRRSRDEAGPAKEEEASIDLDAEAKPADKANRADAPPAAEPAKAKKAAPRSESSAGDIAYDDVGGGGGGLSQSGGYGRGRPAYRPRPVWKVSPGGPPTPGTLAQIESYRRSVDADRTSRSAHRKLVQAAIRAGAPDAFTYARAWAEADPDHAPALLAVADLLAARSDPAAPRAYGSAAEIKPFDKQLQGQLADAYANKGDLARSCAHRRALVSIDPARADFRVQLARCLAGQGRTDMARDALASSRARSAELSRALHELDLGALRPLPPPIPGHADLRATLRFTGPGDVDIAVVDPRGRRLSALRPDDIKVLEAPGSETLTYGAVRKSLAIEVSRISGQGTVTGELTLRTPTVTRTYPFTLDQGSLRLATVSYQMQYGGYSPYYDDHGL